MAKVSSGYCSGSRMLRLWSVAGCAITIVLLLLWLPPAISMATAAEDRRRTIASGPVRIRYWKQHQHIALDVGRYAGEAVGELRRYLDVEMKKPIIINIARSQAEFNRYAGDRKKTWTMGVARPSLRTIVLQPRRDESMRRLVVHELTHIALGIRMSASGRSTPRWVHEGLAQWMEGKMPAEQKEILGEAAVNDELLNFADLDEAFGGKRQTVQLAYAQSHALIACMIRHGPKKAVDDFLRHLSDTGDERTALRRAMGMPISTVEELWLDEIKTNYMERGMPPATDAIVFVVMGLLFIVVVIVRMRRSREIRERLQREEKFEQLAAKLELMEDSEWQSDSDERSEE